MTLNAGSAPIRGQSIQLTGEASLVTRPLGFRGVGRLFFRNLFLALRFPDIVDIDPSDSG